MNSQFRQVFGILLVLTICPMLTVFHGSALAQENGAQPPVDQNDDTTHSRTLQGVDVLIDDFSGLSEQEKAEVRQKLSTEFNNAFSDIGWDESIIIPLAGIAFAAFAVSVPVIIVFLVLAFAHRKRRQRAELISKFAENGQPVPKELLVDYADADVSGQDANMKRGILLMCVGIGVFLALGVLAGWSVGFIGLIPFFIGLARFLIWKLENKHVDNSRGIEG